MQFDEVLRIYVLMIPVGEEHCAIVHIESSQPPLPHDNYIISRKA